MGLRIRASFLRIRASAHTFGISGSLNLVAHVLVTLDAEGKLVPLCGGFSKQKSTEDCIWFLEQCKRFLGNIEVICTDQDAARWTRP